MSQNVLWKSSKKARKESNILDQNTETESDTMDFIDEANDYLLNKDAVPTAAPDNSNALSIDDLISKIEETYEEAINDNKRSFGSKVLTLEEISLASNKNSDSKTDANHVISNEFSGTLVPDKESAQVESSSTSVTRKNENSSCSSSGSRINQQQQKKLFTYIGSSFGLKASTDTTCRPLPCSPLSSWFLCDGIPNFSHSDVASVKDFKGKINVKRSQSFISNNDDNNKLDASPSTASAVESQSIKRTKYNSNEAAPTDNTNNIIIKVNEKINLTQSQELKQGIEDEKKYQDSLATLICRSFQ